MAQTVFWKTYAKYEGSVAEDDIRIIIRLPIASRRVFLDRRTLIAIAIAVDRHILVRVVATRTRTQTKAKWHKMIRPQKLFML
jgi:hypothetical protein